MRTPNGLQRYDDDDDQSAQGTPRGLNLLDSESLTSRLLKQLIWHLKTVHLTVKTTAVFISSTKTTWSEEKLCSILTGIGHLNVPIKPSSSLLSHIFKASSSCYKNQAAGWFKYVQATSLPADRQPIHKHQGGSRAHDYTNRSRIMSRGPHAEPCSVQRSKHQAHISLQPKRRASLKAECRDVYISVCIQKSKLLISRLFAISRVFYNHAKLNVCWCVRRSAAMQTDNRCPLPSVSKLLWGLFCACRPH